MPAEPAAVLLRRAARHLDARRDWISLPATATAALAELLRAVADDAAMVDRMNTAARERADRRSDPDGQTYVAQRTEVGLAVALAKALLGETETDRG